MKVLWDHNNKAFTRAREHLTQIYLNFPDRRSRDDFDNLHMWEEELDVKISRDPTTNQYFVNFKSEEHFTAFLLRWS